MLTMIWGAWLFLDLSFTTIVINWITSLLLVASFIALGRPND